MNVAVMFQDWTYEQVRARVIEAAETLMASPSALGPRMALGSMSDVVRDIMEGYGYSQTSTRRLIAPGALTRMEETWAWINGSLNEEQRKLIYDYSFIKTRKGLYLDLYLKRNDMVRRTFERKIQRYCQIIADNLNRKHRVRLTMALDGLSQNHVEHTSTKVSSEKCATHWIAPDAKPQIDPALAETRVINHREIRARHSDRNRSLGAR
ncbi:hypothetical protein AB3480_00545 [Rhizobium mongolense]|uniref:hypothetical protein n=1 Tax=Rhizobium mongolense TaxID=57676 RepID=UPI0034A47644